MYFSNISSLVFLLGIFQFISFSQSISQLSLRLIQRKIEEDIKEGKFHNAEMLIEENHLNGQVIKDIVMDIWKYGIGLGNDQKTFDMIFKWAMTTAKPHISLNILTQLALLLATQKPIPNDISILNDNCEIYRMFTEKIRNSDEEDQKNLIEESKNTLRKLRKIIVDDAASKMKLHLREDTFPESKTLANKVLMANESVFDETICKVINETYNDFRFRILIENLWKLEFTSQKAAALICIFQSLNRNINNNLQAAFILGDYLKTLKDSNGFQYLFAYKINAINEVIDQLPSSVKRVYFGL